MRAEFEPAARAELLRSVRWYADEAGAMVARNFQQEVRHVINLLLENPLLGAAARHGLRRHPLRRYPYTVFYRAEPDVLRIIAIAHHSRRPDYWSSHR